jgi:hypothetical protein
MRKLPTLLLALLGFAAVSAQNLTLEKGDNIAILDRGFASVERRRLANIKREERRQIVALEQGANLLVGDTKVDIGIRRGGKIGGRSRSVVNHIDDCKVASLEQDSHAILR